MATIIKGKVDALSQRDGTKGPYWYVKINGAEYYCGDSRIADKRGQFVSLEYYKTKSGNDAVRFSGAGQDAPKSAGGDGDQAQASGKREWVPRWRDTEEGDRLDKAFSCRTMNMKYAVDLVNGALAGWTAAPNVTPEEVVKGRVMLVLKTYMVLHDTVALGTDLPGSEKLFLDTKVGETPNIKAESGAPATQRELENDPKVEPQPATPDQRKEIIELAAGLGVVPVKVSKKYIGRQIKTMGDLTASEAEKFIEALKAESDVPF